MARRRSTSTTTRDSEEVTDTLGYGLRFGQRAKRIAWIAAQVLVDHLKQSGFVLMKKPPARTTTPLEPGGPKRLTE